jgi:hypothetical protein
MAPRDHSGEVDRGDFYAAAVYGSIIAAALLAAFRQEHGSSEGTLFALLSTLLVFWIAHVWSTLVGERIHAGNTFRWEQVWRIGRSEWPLVESAFVPSIPLVLGWLGVLSVETSVDVAAAVCFAQLLVWGLAVGRAAYDQWWQVALTGLIDASLGFAVVALELAFVH